MNSGSNRARGLSAEESPHRLPDSTVRVVRRENVDVSVFPAINGDGHRIMIAHPYEFGASLAGILDDGMCPQPDEIGMNTEWGAYQIFSLADLSEIRDGYECLRDRIRHGETQLQIEANPDALQEMIDALVIVERAVAHIRSRDGDERVRHYHRVSALGEDPEEVIVAVQRAVDRRTEPAGVLNRLRTAVMREEKDR